VSRHKRKNGLQAAGPQQSLAQASASAPLEQPVVPKVAVQSPSTTISDSTTSLLTEDQRQKIVDEESRKIIAKQLET
jgi:hypothetical protein